MSNLVSGQKRAPAAKRQSAARDRILDATDRLLIRYGYRKMTVEDIAVEAGIGKGTVYLSFPSKEEVALTCIDRMVDGLLTRLREIAEEPRSIEERLLDMLRLRVLYRFDYASRYAASLDSLLVAVRPAFLARRARHFRSESQIFAALITSEARSWALRTTDAAATAEALVSATNSLLPFSLSARELGRRSDVARRVNNIATLVIAGLRDTKENPAFHVPPLARAGRPARGDSRKTRSQSPR